jgi:hypothetical protein
MKSLTSWLVIAAAIAAPAHADTLHSRYAVQAWCARSGVLGIGADVTVAAAAATAIAQCRAAGGPARCCRQRVKLWRLL